MTDENNVNHAEAIRVLAETTAKMFQVLSEKIDNSHELAMDYPPAGIPVSTGTIWGPSIVDNSANWNTAYGWGDWAVGVDKPFVDALGINATHLGDELPSYYLDYNNFANTPAIPTELADLSDVVSATNTDKFALMANGSSGYVGRALAEADISDLQSYLVNILEDTTPQLGGNLDAQSKNITSINYLSFNAISAPAHSAGLLFYDTDDDELAFYDSISGTKLNIGSEMRTKVRNNSGDAIADFTPVYQTGAIGNRATIAKAKADAESTSLVIAVTTNLIGNNTNGSATTFGTINGVDTDGSVYGESWNDGDEIFLSATTAGWLTNVAPTGNNIKRSIGMVLVAANNGSFEVRINGADVIGVSSSTDNAIVRFDGTSGKRIQNSGVIIDDSDNISAVSFSGDGSNLTGILASQIGIATGVGSPTVDQVQEYFNNTGSSGFFSGGELSDGGAGTLNVAEGEGFIRTTNNDNAELQSFKWSESIGMSVTDDTTQYVYVDYTGTISLTTNEFLEAPDKIQIGVVTKEGGAVEHVFSLGVRLEESIAEAGRFIRRVHGIARDKRKGGLIMGQSGDASRDVSLTSGSLWWGRTEYIISAFDTSGVDTFQTYSASGQEDAVASQWPNGQYDNSGTLTNFSNNRWGNLFWFLEPDNHIVMIYGREQFLSQALAEGEGVPITSLPSKVTETSILLGRFTFQEGSNTAIISSAFDQLFANAGVTDHGNLAGLNDDDHPQYLLADGSRDLTGNLAVDSLITIDGRDLSVDGAKLDLITGTNTGDQTSIVGITGTKAQFDTALTDGNFIYVGDAPTAHTHTFASLTSKPTTIAGYGITDFDSLWDTRLSTKSTTNLSEGTNLYYTQTRFDSAFTAKSTTDLSEGTNLYYTEVRVSANTDVDANTTYRGVGHIPLSQKAANNGVATLDSGGKVPANQLPSSVMDYKGTWNASTNTPTLIDGTGSAGDVYLCNVAGTQDLGSGDITFASGDWVVYSGTIWESSINSNLVLSVNGQTGVVVLTTAHITEDTNLYYTDVRVAAKVTKAYVDALLITSVGIITVGTWNATAIADGYIASAATWNAKQDALTPAALTKTNDTNITLTLGGTPNTSLLQATSLTLGWTGTLADGRIASSTNWNTAYTDRLKWDGGATDLVAATGRISLDVDQAGTDNSTNVTLVGTPNYITISGQIITRGAIVLTTDVSGTLPVANGGTNLTSLSTLLNTNNTLNTVLTNGSTSALAMTVGAFNATTGVFSAAVTAASGSAFTTNQNSETKLTVSNNDGGVSAYTILSVTNDDGNGNGFILTKGTGNPTSGGFKQDGVAIGSGANASGGLSMMARGAAADMRFYTGGNADGNLAYTIDASGNMGFGTSDIEVWATGYIGLEIGAVNSIMSYKLGNGNISINGNAYLTASTGWTYKSTDEASNYYQEGGTHNFRVAASGTINTAISWTNAYTIDASGNNTWTGDGDFGGDLQFAGAFLPDGDAGTDTWFLQSKGPGVTPVWTAIAASQVYKGTWNATTNIPALINGSGTAGNYYRVVVAGTQDFGAGDIEFFVNDDVSYNGSLWQRIPSAGFVLQTATSTVLGGIKLGASLEIGDEAADRLNIKDGDKGDITVTSDGTAWTIDADAVSYSKMQNMTTDRLLGRVTASTGIIEELTQAQIFTFLSSGGKALTKSDDTNVTLTLGGSASTALVNAASLTLGWTGELAVSRGGTGASTFTSNALLTGNTTSAIQAENNLLFDGSTLYATGTTGENIILKNTTNAVLNTAVGTTHNLEDSGNALHTAGYIGFKAEGTWTSTTSTQDAYYTVRVGLNGSTVERLNIASDGTTVITGNISATNLSGTNTGDNAVNSLYSGLVSNVSTNISVSSFANDVLIASSDGSNGTMNASTNTLAGCMSAQAQTIGGEKTFTDNLTVSKSIGAANLWLRSASASDGSSVVFSQTSTDKWLIGYDNSPDTFRIYNYGTASAALLINTSDNIATFIGNVIVPDEAYSASGWNSDLSVPTKNAIRDKLESLSLFDWANQTNIPSTINSSNPGGGVALTNNVNILTPSTGGSYYLPTWAKGTRIVVADHSGVDARININSQNYLGHGYVYIMRPGNNNVDEIIISTGDSVTFLAIEVTSTIFRWLMIAEAGY